MQCNLCGNDQFIDMNGRKGVRCSSCRSLERTRLLWFFLEREIKSPATRVLHLAPEKGLYDRLAGILLPDHYDTADIDPKRHTYCRSIRKIDLCALDDEPSRHYDIIIHSHVLEHTACNIAYSLFHLHRMLKQARKHICVIPFLSGKYDECFQDIGNDERTRRFGQFDHVRRFGSADLDRHLGKLVRLPASFDVRDFFPEEALLDANIPRSAWSGWTGHTVLVLDKDDFLLR